MCNVEIMKDGVILKNGIPAKLSNHTSGYKVVWIDGKLKYAHRLVAENYIPNPNGFRTINHINGIKTDNRVENLEWASDRMNTEHARLNGLSEKKQLGIKNLTKDEVLYIINEKEKGRTYKSIAIEMERDYRTIWDICNGKRYKDYIRKEVSLV